VPRERIFGPQVVERRIELCLVDAPRDERTRREIRRHERLANSPNRSRGEHRTESFVHGLDWEARQSRDLGERIFEKPGDAVLGNGENLRVDRIGDLGRSGGMKHEKEDSRGWR